MERMATAFLSPSSALVPPTTTWVLDHEGRNTTEVADCRCVLLVAPREVADLASSVQMEFNHSLDA